MKIIIDNQEFNVDIADTFIKRLFGLMFKKNIKKGLIFPKTGSIHTFFMMEKIDIIMLDKDKKIIYYEKNVKKNKIIIKKKAYYTIELPNNSLNNITTYDTLTIKE